MYNSRLSQHKSSCYHWFQRWRNIFAVISQSDFISDKPYGRTPQRGWHSWELVPGLGPWQEQLCRRSGMECAQAGEAGRTGGSRGPQAWVAQFAVLCVAVCAFCRANGFVPVAGGLSRHTWALSSTRQRQRSSSSFTPKPTWRSLPVVTGRRCPAPDREMTAALGKEELSGFISPLLAAYLLLYSF